MNNLYNVNLEELELKIQTLEQVKKEAFQKGVEAGYAMAQAGYRKGREVGFQAGFAAAQQQPQEKIEAAYEQGYRAGAMTPQEDAALDELLSPSNTKESS